MTRKLNETFGRLNDEGNVCVLDRETGESVTCIEDAYGLYPVGSEFGSRYEHPQGIVITQDDAAKFGIEIER